MQTEHKQDDDAPIVAAPPPPPPMKCAYLGVVCTPHCLEERLSRPYDADYVKDIQQHVIPLRMMVVDLECINRYNRTEYTSDLGPIDCPKNQMSVPVYKLHGVTENGMSCTTHVYGFFPFVYLKVTPALSRYNVEPFIECIETILAETDERLVPRMPEYKQMKHVLAWNIEEAFCCDEYREQPDTVIRLTLALPAHCTYLGEHFFNENLPKRQHDDMYDSNRITLPLLGQVRVQPFNCLDASTQFLMESQLTGFGWVSFSSVELVDDDSFRERGRAQIECLAHYADMCVMHHEQVVAPLRVLTFDIECGNTQGFPQAQRDPIISLSMVLSDEHGKKHAEIVLQHGYADQIGGNVDHICFWHTGDDLGSSNPKAAKDIQDDIERALLDTWASIVTQWWDPDVIVGHNSKAFDLPYVIDRAHTLQLPEAESIGRIQPYWRPNREIVKKRKNGDTVTSKESIIVGRLQMDTMVQVKADPMKKERSYGLGALAQKYLGDGKDDVGYKLITPLWKTSNYTRRRLALYNMKDSILTHGLFEKFSMLQDVIQTSRVTRIMPNTLVKSGQQVKVWAQLLHESIHPEWHPRPELRALLPFEVPQEVQRDEKVQGACVLDPMQGFHTCPVAVADYASLYPSIMISRNICYSTYIRNTSTLYRMRERQMCETTPANATFVTSAIRVGLVSKLLCKLLDARKVAKKELEKADATDDKIGHIVANSKQGALKVVANSMYGFMNASGGRLRRPCMAESVTLYGQQHIQLAKQVAESFGYQVAYGDTDSIFILIKGVDIDALPSDAKLKIAFEKLHMICKIVTEKINRFPVALQAEKVYMPYLLLEKKHYAALKFMSPNDANPKIDMKGIETARRDYCPYSCRVITDVLDKLLHGMPIPDLIQVTREHIAKLVSGNVKFHELIMTRSLNKLEYTNKQAHAELAKRLVARNTGYQMIAGERIPYVIINKPDAKLVSEKSEDPIYAIEHHLPIDYNYYAMNQLKKPLIRLLHRVIVKEQASVVNSEKAAERILFGYDMRQMCTIKQCVPAESSISKFFTPVPKCNACHAPMPIKRTTPTQSSSTKPGQHPPPHKRHQTNTGKSMVTQHGLAADTMIPTTNDQTPTPALPSASSLYCPQCIKTHRDIHHQETLKQQYADLESAHLALRKRCATCRGYDDDTACVQVDCKYMFKRVVAISDMKLLQTKMIGS